MNRVIRLSEDNLNNNKIPIAAIVVDSSTKVLRQIQSIYYRHLTSQELIKDRFIYLKVSYQRLDVYGFVVLIN